MFDHSSEQKLSQFSTLLFALPCLDHLDRLMVNCKQKKANLTNSISKKIFFNQNEHAAVDLGTQRNV